MLEGNTLPEILCISLLHTTWQHLGAPYKYLNRGSTERSIISLKAEKPSETIARRNTSLNPKSNKLIKWKCL